jgi:hypothetical protein
MFNQYLLFRVLIKL